MQQKLQVAHHPPGLPGGGGHEELGLANAAGGAVIHHDAVFTQHEAIARLTHWQLGKAVHIHPVQKLGGIRPVQRDLAQRGGVGDADLFAHDRHFCLVRLGQAGAVAAVPEWPNPQAGFDLDAAMGQVPVVHGGTPHRLQVGADAASGQCADGGGGEGRTEGGGAHFLHPQAARCGHDGQTIQVRGFALVGAHAQRGVTLEVLNRLVTFAMRQFHVAYRHVMLEVDKGLAGDVLVDQRSDRSKYHGQRVRHGRGRWRYRCRGGLAGRGDGLFGSLPAAGQGLVQRLAAHHAASTKVLAVKSARHKVVHIGLVHRFDATVRGQVHSGRPAA